MADTQLMSIPGQNDPVPVARDITPRADGRVDLIGLPKDRIRTLFEEAGLDAKQAKLRAKQVFHWIYHRGVSDFEAMTDIAKTIPPTGLASGFCKPRTGMILRWYSYPMLIGEPYAFPHRSDAHLTAASAIQARCGSCVTSLPARSLGRSCWRAMHWESGTRAVWMA